MSGLAQRKRKAADGIRVMAEAEDERVLREVVSYRVTDTDLPVDGLLQIAWRPT